MEKILVISLIALAAASAAPAPDCEDGQCSCILPIVIMPGGGTGGLLNNLLEGGILNGGLVNIDKGNLLGNLLGGLLGGRSPTAAAGTPVYRWPNGGIVGDGYGSQIGDVSGILNNALAKGVLNGGAVNIGEAGQAALAYGAQPLRIGRTQGLLNNLAPLGALNAGLVNA
ncbi:Hypothetical protein NTJ_13006 [Nesidiocoris tenuis]|uniref:Uncharacterized protein n=1 Tax=Nesidiocoris tenuis TaxID=355587 RepID=A0ABN7B7D5_9HEMI|nr:Hypothetical protein NTJ_13006 [Nesidiocoris tenuis]